MDALIQSLQVFSSNEADQELRKRVGLCPSCKPVGKYIHRSLQRKEWDSPGFVFNLSLFEDLVARSICKLCRLVAAAVTETGASTGLLGKFGGKQLKDGRSYILNLWTLIQPDQIRREIGPTVVIKIPSSMGKVPAPPFTPSIRLLAEDAELLPKWTGQKGLGRRVDPAQYDPAGLRDSYISCTALHGDICNLPPDTHGQSLNLDMGIRRAEQLLESLPSWFRMVDVKNMCIGSIGPVNKDLCYFTLNYVCIMEPFWNRRNRIWLCLKFRMLWQP
jgi:hypothetical protein